MIWSIKKNLLSGLLLFECSKSNQISNYEDATANDMYSDRKIKIVREKDIVITEKPTNKIVTT